LVEYTLLWHIIIIMLMLIVYYIHIITT
jgi:hypothetical protein